MQQHDYKLLVLDVDGTLLNRENRIAAADIAAVKQVAAAGIRVALCTGRVPQSCRWILRQLGLDGYHVFFDGGLVFNPETGHEVYAVPLAPDLVRETTAMAAAEGLHYDVYSATHFYTQSEDWATEIRRSFFRLEPTLTDFDTLSRRERLIKGTIVTRTPVERKKAARLQHHFAGRLIFSWTTTPAYPEVHFINVIDPAVNKGTALQSLCEFIGVTPAQVVAIGDGENDIALLQRAGLAIAMGDSNPSLQSCAHAVTLNVENAGVAKALHRFVL